MNFVNQIFSKQFWTAERIIEILAVISSFLYTFLYIKGNPLCWFFAFTGAVLFTYLCYVRKILAESFLQFIYVLMAVYGYLNIDAEWQINVWSWQQHAIWI
ncbi:MAG: nicotinamide mononucleotide transporter, partial [Flavobacteriales bacterium]